MAAPAVSDSMRPGPRYGPDRPPARSCTMRIRIRSVAVLLACMPAAACATLRGGSAAGGFDVVEASIADIHGAMRAGRLTAVQLVREYLARIAAYDTAGPGLNAIITTNPRAIEVAASLDTSFFETGELVGPLHGIPVIDRKSVV